MRLHLLVFLAVTLAAVPATLAEAQSTTVPVDSLRKWCSELFVLDRSEDQGQVGFSTSVVQPENWTIIADLAESHAHYLGYLFDHSQTVLGTGDNSLFRITDEVERNRAFRSALKQDTSLSQWLLPAVAHWLLQKKVTVTALPPVTVDTSAWTWDEVAPLAVRFVYINGLDSTGQYQTYFCIEVNGIKEYTGRKNLWIEAFAFEAIMNDLMSADSRILDEYQRLGRQVRPAAAAADSATSVHRAQGAMFALMGQSEIFRGVLRTAYPHIQNLLPVRIVEQ